MKRAIPPGGDVWIVHLSDADTVSDTLLVSDEDRARYGRILPLPRRRLFIFRRHVRDYVLRQYALHHKVRVDGASGKPYVLSRRGRQPLYFSTSASANVCAVGVSRRPLGLDVEASDRAIDMVEICDRFLPQFKRWSALRNHKDWMRHTALGAWCRTEAYGKLNGVPLHALLVNQEEAMDHCAARPRGSDALITGEGFVCAVSQAVPCEVSSVQQLTFARMLSDERR